MKKCLKRLSFFTLFLLGACSSTSTPTPGPTVHYLEQDALYALKLNLREQAEGSLLAALKHYQSVDDLTGQWRIRYLMVTNAIARDDSKSATLHADDLEQLSHQINASTEDYKTSLLLGQVRGEKQYYEAALASARTPLERAIATTYLGDTTEAIKLMAEENIGEPGDRAFIYYRHAKQTDLAQYFHLALEEYRAAQDSRGISDSLLSLALLSAKNGRIEQAKDYGQRASRSLASIGLKNRADAVDQWLSTL